MHHRVQKVKAYGSGKSGPKDQVALHYYYTSPSHWCTTHGPLLPLAYGVQKNPNRVDGMLTWTRPQMSCVVMYTVTALGHAPDVAQPFSPAHRRRYGP